MREIMYQAAANLHSLGYNVLPLRPRSKKPFHRAWKLRQERRHSRVELRSFFSRNDCNLAVIMGQLEETGVNVLGIDADCATALAYIESHWPVSPIQTLTARGRHLLYQLLPG